MEGKKMGLGNGDKKEYKHSCRLLCIYACVLIYIQTPMQVCMHKLPEQETERLHGLMMIVCYQMKS